MTSEAFKRKLLEEFWTPSGSDVFLLINGERINVSDVYLDGRGNIIIEAKE